MEFLGHMVVLDLVGIFFFALFYDLVLMWDSQHNTIFVVFLKRNLHPIFHSVCQFTSHLGIVQQTFIKCHRKK